MSRSASIHSSVHMNHRSGDVGTGRWPENPPPRRSPRVFPCGPGGPARGFPLLISSGRRAVISVSMNPGATELTRMSRPLSSWARDLVSASRAAFSIAYGIWPAFPVWPTTLEMLMIRPLPGAEHEEAQDPLRQVPGAPEGLPAAGRTARPSSAACRSRWRGRRCSRGHPICPFPS